MKIGYLGHSAFLLTAEDGTRIVTDPYEGVGYRMPRTEADCVVCSHAHFDHANVQGVSGVKEVIAEAGAHTFGPFKVTGIPAWHDEVQGAKRGANLVFLFEADGVCVCHMGDIGQPPAAELIGRIGQPDALLVPVGGVYTVDAAGAAAYVRAIRPKIAVPMHYHLPGGTLGIASPEAFLREMQERGAVRIQELALPCKEAEGKVVVLEVQR